MPSRRFRQMLVALGVTGTLLSCGGCSLAFANQMSAARILLIIAWLILVPLFFYLIILRNRANAEHKRRLRKKDAQLKRELEALATVEGVLSAGGVANQEPNAGDREPAASGPEAIPSGPQPLSPDS